MNTSRLSSGVFVLGAALALTLTACGSDSDTASDAPATSATTSRAGAATSTESAATTCPTTAPAEAGSPDWTYSGTTGSVAVVGPTDTAAPSVEVQAPFGVDRTQVQTLRPGTGPVVSDSATVSVCYMGVNGRDGSVFDSSYERGAPVEFPLDNVVAGFQKSIAGQTVGSTVAVAVTSEDGYPDGQPRAGIAPGDSLVFVISILDASS